MTLTQWPLAARQFCQTFDTALPFMNAPMQGVSTPAMVAATAEAGALGVLAADGLSAQQLTEQIEAVAQRTGRAFAVNLRVPAKKICWEGREQLHEALTELLAQLDCPTEFAPDPVVDFEEQFDVVVSQRVPFVCASFGGLREIYADKLKALGVRVIGAATTLKEVKVMRSAQVDAVIVQGAEAGGPRLNFEDRDTRSCVGLLSLIGSARRVSGLPVIASGGLMTGAQVAAAMVAGASAAQCGTALVATQESQAHRLHKQALAYASDASSVLTRVFNGRLTRVLGNGLQETLEEAGLGLCDYPAQWTVMAALERAAQSHDRDDLMMLCAGQGAGSIPQPDSTQLFFEQLGQDTLAHL